MVTDRRRSIGNVPKGPRESVDDIVRREAPGYVISKPKATDARQQAKPDAVVPPIDAIRRKALKRGPGADASRVAAPISRKRDTEVRLIEPKGRNADASGRAMGPKAVIVSKSKGKIVSRQG
jgi:hypothetical protein